MLETVEWTLVLLSMAGSGCWPRSGTTGGLYALRDAIGLTDEETLAVAARLLEAGLARRDSDAVTAPLSA